VSLRGHDSSDLEQGQVQYCIEISGSIKRGNLLIVCKTTSFLCKKIVLRTRMHNIFITGKGITYCTVLQT
jgi:hypothetical protein